MQQTWVKYIINAMHNSLFSIKIISDKDIRKKAL